MCGIAGIILREGAPSEDNLFRMARILGHRGPDDHGIYVHGRVGFAHTRLSIIDLSGGHQPLYNTERTLALVANGEVYNYVELHVRLSREGCRFLTRSDSEAILHAYAFHGDGFLPHLHGMFAFALHDTEKREVILARDRLGIKPLFYLTLRDGIAFASEIKALLPLLPHGPSLNPGALMQFLQSDFTSGEDTIIRGIKRLPPAHAMRIRANLSVERWRYWNPTEVQTRSRSFQEAKEEFDALLDEVMREHVRSDVPYGLFLSGGVDSATLCALLNRYQPRSVRTFSIGFTENAAKCELDDAQRIANLFGTLHTPITASREAVFRRIPFVIWETDELMKDYACLPTSILAEETSKELKVVFTGEGGDEVFAGYGRYRRHPLQRWGKSILAPGSGGFRTRGHWKRRWSSAVFGQALRASLPTVREPFVKAWRESPGSWSYIQRGQYTDMTTAMRDDLLVKVDRILMGFGLEGRVPYLDHRVLEFGLSLPDSLKVRSRQGKLFLKGFAEGHLPSDHVYQKKRGFNIPVDAWFTPSFLKGLTDKLLQNAAIREWFIPEGVKRLFARQLSRGDVSNQIWNLMHFAIWHHIFIENPGTRPSVSEYPLDWIS
jgi:asparagine synthase (glutamine-hydrolysing)